MISIISIYILSNILYIIYIVNIILNYLFYLINLVPDAPTVDDNSVISIHCGMSVRTCSLPQPPRPPHSSDPSDYYWRSSGCLTFPFLSVNLSISVKVLLLHQTSGIRSRGV